MRAQVGAIARNLSSAEALVREAFRRGARCVILPEFFPSAVAFTPTIVHFGTALLLSALLRAPWQIITIAASLCGFIGLIGIIYAIIVARRMRVQTFYNPEFEDWLFYALLPLTAYTALVLSAFAAPFYTREAFLALGLPPSCCSSSAFAMPGTASLTMCLSASRINTERRRQQRRGATSEKETL
jgi:hypothetical protein